jgi:hypothetical protein
MMTTTSPFPTLDPRAPGEDLHAYGWRALLFCLATGNTGGCDDDALQLAHYVFPVAVAGGRQVAERSAEQLADCQRRISAALRGRLADQAERLAALAEQAAPAGVDRPNLGPGAPLAPAPIVPTAPAAALPVPTLRQPAGIAAALTPAPRPAAPAPQAPQAAPRPAFQPVARPVARPAAPQVSAAEWGF